MDVHLAISGGAKTAYQWIFAYNNNLANKEIGIKQLTTNLNNNTHAPFGCCCFFFFALDFEAHLSPPLPSKKKRKMWLWFETFLNNYHPLAKTVNNNKNQPLLLVVKFTNSDIFGRVCECVCCFF